MHWDLLDKGGFDFESINFAYELFNDDVIGKIQEELDFPKEQFLIVPGNHDIDRAADEEPIDIGYTHYFKKEYNNISSFMQSAISEGKRVGISRMIPFKEFEEEFYADFDKSQLSIFGSSLKYNINGTRVGVCCLNSSWRAYNVNDKGNLILGEDQLNENLNFIADCEIKIGLQHHPTDWLIESEKNIISSHISKEFDLFLVGHVHENQTTIQTGFTGTLFTNMAPAYVNDIREKSKAFGNGFTIIDFDKNNKRISCQYFKFNMQQKEFILNTEEGEEGCFNHLIPDRSTTKDKNLINRLLETIKEEHFKSIDEHLITQKACEGKSNSNIKSNFILPPIDDGDYLGEEAPTTYNLNSIVKSAQNLVLFGNQEVGKTTLLYRLLVEYIEQFEHLRKIPVYLDLQEIGNKDVLTCLKEYLRCSTKDVTYLLKENLIVLLLDNIYYSETDNYVTNKITRFNQEFDSTQVIATSDSNFTGVAPVEFVNLCNIPFKRLYIRNLKTKHVKNLMKLWLPKEDSTKSDNRLHKMVSNFNSYSLPCTAMSVSLFLWTTENYDRKPINHAVLLDIYVELILEKVNGNNIYRDTFDFRNKCLLISVIAQEMLVKDNVNYQIKYSEYIKVIEDYLNKKVGFDYDSNKIATYFIDRKIFIKTKDDKIRFSKSCFFHFFLAKRMEYNKEFRDYVLHEDNYSMFPKEIDYYTGLVRNDEETLRIIYNRFKNKFEPTEFILDKVKVDEYFTKIGDTEHESVTKEIDIDQVKDDRPSEESIEEFYNEQLAQIKNPNEILKKNGDLSLEKLLVIMCNVVRNSEGVENFELKKNAYALTVRNSLIWTILYRESIVHYVIEKKQMPPAIPSNISLEYLLKNLPFHVQLGLFQHLGTSKLAPIILEKIGEDLRNKVSDVELYFSVGLYSDIQGKNYPKQLKSLIKKVDKKQIIIDYVFRKIIGYYYRRTKVGSANEQVYLDLIADVKMKNEKISKRFKDSIIKKYKENKSRLFLKE